MLPVWGSRIGDVAMRGCSDGLVKVAGVTVMTTLDAINGKSGPPGILQPCFAWRWFCLTSHK